MRLRNSGGTRVERILDYLDEIYSHPLHTQLERGTLTPSSLRRLHRHIYRRVRLPLHPPRLALRLAPLEGERRSLPGDQRPQGRDILNVLCCAQDQIVRAVIHWQQY